MAISTDGKSKTITCRARKGIFSDPQNKLERKENFECLFKGQGKYH